MTISVNCPECGKTLKAKESAAGKKAKCPSCGGTIQIPNVVEAVDAESLDDDYGGGPNFDDFSGMEDSGTAVEREPDRRPCPVCGEMIAEKAAKCRFCGEIFDKTLKKKKKKKGSSSDQEELTGVDWVLIVLCSGIACILGIIRMIQGNPTGGKMVLFAILAQLFWVFVRIMLEAAARG
jgi:DNA-directed RNA polymerase subunit M/transcription elongation factor TFIIS